MDRHQTKGQDYDRLISGYSSLKRSFRLFFEGYDGYNPTIDIPIYKFEITNITFNETNDRTEMTITLGRPGILIGKAGTVLYQIEDYLSNYHDRPVKILIVESKLWS